MYAALLALGHICGRKSHGACPTMSPPCLEAKHPSKRKPTKMGNFIDAMGACEAESGLPIFGNSPSTSSFRDLK